MYLKAERKCIMEDFQSLKDLLLLQEELLLNEAVRDSREKLNELLADDFMEFGSTGRIFDKEHILELLPNESDPQMTLSNFDARVLASDVVQTIYLVHRKQDMTYSLRSSIWKRNAGKWQMTFHQGTFTEEYR
jgi:hypothetical protein